MNYQQEQPGMQQMQPMQMQPMQTYVYENIPEANISMWALAPGSRIVFINQNEGKIVVKSFPYGAQQVTVKTFIDESTIAAPPVQEGVIDIPQNFRDDIDYLKKEVRKLNNIINKNKPKES